MRPVPAEAGEALPRALWAAVVGRVTAAVGPAVVAVVVTPEEAAVYGAVR